MNVALSYAMLLDGGFVRRKLSAPQHPVTEGSVGVLTSSVQAMECLSGMRLHRIYFYDARPLETSADVPLGGGHIDFGTTETATRNRDLQAALHRRPYFALRYGELAHEGWELRPRVLHRTARRTEVTSIDLKPTIRQKGVDMRIGLDIAALTLKKQVQMIVLVTADSDFIPAMKFARREGAQLVLITLGHGIKEGMREHADLVIEDLPLHVP